MITQDTNPAEPVYTDEQLRSIEHLGGHRLTFAVPGSGKTHALVGRVLFLLEQGVPAKRIRVLAFNVNAKDEFSRRLSGALPLHAQAPKVSTFHSLGLRLTELFEQQGFLPRQRLETNDWVEKRLAREAVAAAVQALGIDETPGPDEHDAFVSFIGLVKSDILSAADAFAAFDLPLALRYFIRAFAQFETARQAAGLRFYSDLIADPVTLMRAGPAGARARHQPRLEWAVRACRQPEVEALAGGARGPTANVRPGPGGSGFSRDASSQAAVRG